MLAIFLLDLLQDLTDQAVEIHDRQINNLLATGRKTQNEMQVQNGKTINEKLNNYVKLIDVLDKAKSERSDPYRKIEESIIARSFGKVQS